MDSELLRDTVRRFVADKVAPIDAAADRDGELPQDLWRQLGDLGLSGLLVPAEFGGGGADAAAAVVVAEELAVGSAALSWMWIEHTGATWILAELGTEATKARFLPRLATGELVGSSLKMTETGGGSNPAAVTTTARAAPGGYILDGSKVFQGLAGTAHLYLVVTRTDPVPDAGLFSVFVVEQDRAGVSFGARERTMGLRALSIGEIVLDSCEVPAEHLVGPAGGLERVLAHHGRVTPLLVAGLALGLAEVTMRETLTFIAGRKVAGQRLAELPVIQLRVADLLIELEGARGLLERALRGEGPPALGALAKVAASEMAAQVIDSCLKLHGSAGYSADLPIERRARDVRALPLHYGTNDQLRLLAGRIVLGQAGRGG